MAGAVIGRQAAMIPRMGAMHARADLLADILVWFVGSESNSSFVRTEMRMMTLIN